MKTKGVYILSGFAAGVMLTGGVTMAATNLVQAQRNQATIHVNGGFATSGNSLIYDGSTYASLYAIQQSLQKAGLQTSWDGHDFNIQDPSLQQGLSASVALNSLSPVSIGESTIFAGGTMVNKFTDMFNNTYDSGMSVETKGTNGQTYYDVTYNLNGEYKQLKGTLVPDLTYQGQTQFPDVGNLTIIGDGQTLYSSGDVTSGINAPIQVSVNLTNVQKLEIKLKDGSSAGTLNWQYGKLGFVGVNLYR
ncbi:NPCBM/NEW2 domain-containing protein [Alicyclobacillus tolerans]|uniref:NPCBM/NEW2 domain-containing protein n=1 Tax=Alicyclobacillus tolerans TaxID=90970 RepID=UPI001F42DA4C|nr:NPCBM/NEW2 domain-containing protein [Alicyclobacillus tolerans]MCF8567840.1 NPCBM/NEW2 domain-containing protein [Alicyclobacillus tolerans]